MNLTQGLASVGLLLGAMAALSLLEMLMPLRARSHWSGKHVAPNLALTLLTIGGSLFLNVAILLGLLSLQSRG